jgi:hypothetical protein
VLKRCVLFIPLLAIVALATQAFDAYFADSQGNKITQIWEGRRFWVVVDDRELGACPPGEFTADLVIFDFKTGAYIEEEGVTFKEIPNQSGIYYWVDDNGNKIWIQVGDRYSWTAVNNMEHILGTTSAPTVTWEDGVWTYVDEDVEYSPWPLVGFFVDFPQRRLTWRGPSCLGCATNDRNPGAEWQWGRFENMDTLVLIVAAEHDERLIDQDQLKIVDTTSTISVEPGILEYGCGVMCNVRVTIVDEDENLDPTEIDYVPFFVIVNPGSWNPDTTQTNPDTITTFCDLKMLGGVNADGDPLEEPIRWYNIYDQPVAYDVNNDGDTDDPGENSRFIDYPDTWLDNGTIAPVLFYAWETAPDSGVFVYDFGLLEDLQEALGFNRFPAGTTIAFYYLDPNDFDDFSLTTAQVYERPRSEVYFTDSMGNPVDEVKIGAHTGLYVRVYDADANIEACCQDKVVVGLCDPHNEDDSEYWILDEVANDAGIFASMAAMPLEPVWDAIGGYQLVFDDWKFQAFNEDTIYVRYNSMDYVQEALNALGNGDPNETITVDETELGFDVNKDGDTTDTAVTIDSFPPLINEAASRNQVWDVSFDTVKVYDTQVFDGETHHMRFLNGRYEYVDVIPLNGNLYLEVIDPDQNENPLMSELISGNWNKDAASGEDTEADEDSAPIWKVNVPEGTVSSTSTTGEMGSGEDVEDGFTPAVADNDIALEPVSITGLAASVKIFMWNAQRGTWERMDLKETAPNSGIFRSTTCVLVADARHPGDGNLGSQPEDTIMAFYQDPSNHSDISIISIRVAAGGAAGVTPPERLVKVEFDEDTYVAGETVTITITDDAFAGASEITGTDILVLELNGDVLETWNTIPLLTMPGAGNNKFQVSYTLANDVSGTLTVTYTQPFPGGKTVSDTAEVIPAELENVTGIEVTPNPFDTEVTFTIVAEPAGAVADKLTVTVYDLLGRKVAEVSGTNTASVTWDGNDLRNGAYIYVAVVEGGDAVWTFRGFVYIKR